MKPYKKHLDLLIISFYQFYAQVITTFKKSILSNAIDIITKGIIRNWSKAVILV